MNDVNGLMLKNGHVGGKILSDFDVLKKELGFAWAEHFYFYINDTEYVAICDDEGLLKPNHISIYVCDNELHTKQVIAGNVFICKPDYKNEDYSSLNEKDLYNLFSHLYKMENNNCVLVLREV